jgi:MinD-like ATPase involved in chromosome partitioning or flagellar assembly
VGSNSAAGLSVQNTKQAGRSMFDGDTGFANLAVIYSASAQAVTLASKVFITSRIM